MFTLYKYELKKIFSQKAFLWAFLLLLLLVNAIACTPMVTGSIENVKAKQEISGRVIDESLIYELNDDKENNKFYDIKEFIKYCTNSNQYEGLSEKDIYNKRLETLDQFFKEDYLYDDEIKYWNDKENKLVKPFTYEKADAYTEVYNSVYVLNFVSLILVAISIAGIFADEKSSGADQIIYSSKNGRNKLFISKALAALTVGIVIPVVIYVPIVLTNVIVYGSDGFDACLQIFMPQSLYSFSIGESVIIMFGLLVVASLTYVAFAFFLSIITKNRSTSSAAMIVMMFLSMFNIPNRYRLLSHLWNIIPSGHIGTWTLLEYRLFNIFGHYFNTLQYSPIIWLFVSVLFVLAAKFAYSKYQVEGK